MKSLLSKIETNWIKNNTPQISRNKRYFEADNNNDSNDDDNNYDDDDSDDNYNDDGDYDNGNDNENDRVGGFARREIVHDK